VNSSDQHSFTVGMKHVDNCANSEINCILQWTILHVNV